MAKFVAWQVVYYQKIFKFIKKIDNNNQQNLKYYFEKIATYHNPRKFAKRLKGKNNRLWLYNCRNFKIICKIDQERMLIVVLDIL